MRGAFAASSFVVVLGVGVLSPDGIREELGDEVAVVCVLADFLL